MDDKIYFKLEERERLEDLKRCFWEFGDKEDLESFIINFGIKFLHGDILSSGFNDSWIVDEFIRKIYMK